MKLSAILRSQLTALTQERDSILSGVAKAADFTDELRSKVNEINERRSALEAEITAAEEREAREEAAAAASLRDGEPTGVEHRTPTRVTREERTYTAVKDTRGEASFFVDAYRFTRDSDPQARQRLERHANEVIAEREISERATTTGSFAGLVVPQYLVDQAALVLRAGRPTADACQSLPLPAQGTTFQIPRGTTGAAVASQNGENTAVQSTDEAWANLQINVQTIAGQQDVSRQSLERGTPGIDQLVYTDLAGAYAAELDRQVINGSGTAGQLLGILGTSGINKATAFGAAVTAANFFSKTAGQVQAVASTRFLPATVIVMHPRRWGWYLAQVDSQGRPLAVPSGNGPYNAHAVYAEGQDYGRVVGYLQGLPVVTDANMPTNVGANSEDVELVMRVKDCLLWEDGDGMPRQLRFEQTLGGQLTVKLVVYGYAAFTAGRYPTAVGQVGGLDATAGQGLIAPTF